MRSKEIEIGLEGVTAKIFYHSFNKVPIKTLLVSFGKMRRVLSTREGFKEVKAVGNNYNPPPLWDMVHERWNEYLSKVISDVGYKDEEVALLSTGADVDNLGKDEESFKDFKVVCLATAGVSSNAMRLSEDIAKTYERNGKFFPVGTINIILLSNASFSDGALTRAIITITEAKTASLQDLDIRSSYTPLVNQATGTGTDNMIVVSGTGPKINYVGGHSKMGELIAKSTAEAVKRAIHKQNGVSLSRPLEERLKERGITMDELVKTGLKMYIPHPKTGNEKRMEKLLKKELTKALKDINVASLILAGLRLEEEGEKGQIPHLAREDYKKDPVHLIADEMLGIQIATYIGGSRALFEFERFDKMKPGILKNLPPFLDDVIGGLVSGVLVKICSE